MNDLLPIFYSGFWDVPHAFYTKLNDDLFLFWRDEFNDEIDAYPSEYKVYRITTTTLEDAIEPCSFSTPGISMKFVPSFEENEFMGIVSIDDVKFDKTK